MVVRNKLVCFSMTSGLQEGAGQKLTFQPRTSKHEVFRKFFRKPAFCWLPPRDSNPDMLIQSQLSCR